MASTREIVRAPSVPSSAWPAQFAGSEANARAVPLLAAMTRWYTPAETLIMATSANAELLALSGPRNPYPGVLGRVEAGAIADLLLVEGNPLDDLSLFTTPETSLRVIMQGGIIHKG